MASTVAAGSDATKRRSDAAILVVDDNHAKRVAIRSILEPLGHAIVEAGSGQEALHAVSARTFAVILMDVEMPEMDGYDAAKLIRKVRGCEHTPVIFVTAYSEDEAQLSLAYDSGAVDFISAPLMPAVLRAKITIFVALYDKSREVEESSEIAIEASRAKSEFVANMSHEMRTPLNGVLGMATLLAGTALDATQRKYVEALTTSGEALLAVIGDVLDFSKIEAGHLDLDGADFDLRETVHEACQMLSKRAHAKGLEISHLVAKDVPAEVHGDRARLRQILLNLLSNAVKFTAVGEVSVRLERQGRDRLLFCVRDTGVGIKSDEATSLFDAFVQADLSTTREYGGTGLGLTISRQLVEAMGGEIGARARDVGGSLFWFTAELPEVSAAAAHLADGHPQLRGARALVVGDNATNRAVIEYYAESWGIESQAVADVAAAIDAMEHAVRSGRAFELVVLDVNVPLMSGIDLVDAIRQRPALSTSKIVLLTSASLDAEKLADGVIAAVLAKPARQSAIHDAIADAVAGIPTRIERSQSPVVEAADRGLLVLNVEDDPINRMVTGALLAKSGLRADVARNGREAIEMAARTDYAAIFMDCQMPEVDGFDATQQIRVIESGRRVPIIALTALTMPRDRRRCIESGMDDYLTKPLQSDELSRAIERWLPVAQPTPAVDATDGMGRRPGNSGRREDLVARSGSRARQPPGAQPSLRPRAPSIGRGGPGPPLSRV